MTSNRMKVAARRLQTEQSLPYAEALRRVTTQTPEPEPSRLPTGHKCVGTLNVAGELGTHKICRRCATDAEAARVAAVDQAARDLKILRPLPGMGGVWRGLDWPYGPNIDLDSREALVAWAAPLGLRETSSSRKCLHWLQGKHCPRNGCDAGVPGADHTTAWNRGPGRNPAVIVTQPYHLDERARQELAKIHATRGLRVEIDENGGWYLFGTVFVAVWRDDVVGAAEL